VESSRRKGRSPRPPRSTRRPLRRSRHSAPTPADLTSPSTPALNPPPSPVALVLPPSRRRSCPPKSVTCYNPLHEGTNQGFVLVGVSSRARLGLKRSRYFERVLILEVEAKYNTIINDGVFVTGDIPPHHGLRQAQSFKRHSRACQATARHLMSLELALCQFMSTETLRDLCLEF
jgi:hypothetical protein